MSRPLHILMILLFALMQCVAPLVHAHVEGPQTAAPADTRTFHLDLHIDHGPVAQPALEKHISQTIDLPQELQRDNAPAIAPLFSATLLPHLAVSFRTPNQALTATAFRSLAYQTPQPHAPPACA